MNDESAREKEGELRSNLLRDILGDFETVSPQGELKKYVDKFEKEQHCNVYQIIMQGKNLILLYVSYEQPFWKMFRPKNGPIGVYVQGCVMNKKTGEIENWKLVPVVVKRHKLSIEKSIVGLDN